MAKVVIESVEEGMAVGLVKDEAGRVSMCLDEYDKMIQPTFDQMIEDLP